MFLSHQCSYLSIPHPFSLKIKKDICIFLNACGPHTVFEPALCSQGNKTNPSPSEGNGPSWLTQNPVVLGMQGFKC